MTILNYAKFIMKEPCDYKCSIKFDRSKPNGTPRKILNSNLAKNMDGNIRPVLKKGSTYN